jgi:hypothetical protein
MPDIITISHKHARHGRIILGWIFRKQDVGVRTGLGWLRIGTGGGRM